MRRASALPTTLALLLPLLTPAGSLAATRVVTGKAYDLASGELVYTMRVDEQLDGMRIVRSRLQCHNVAGKLIYSQELRYEHEATAPSLDIVNHNTGAEEQATRVGKASVIRFKSGRDAEADEATLEVPTPVVHTGGINILIAAHWDELMNGRDVKLAFVAPSRMAWYHMRLRKVGETRRQDRPVLIIALEPDNSVLRLFAGDLRLYFDTERKEMLEYEGRDAVTDEDGDAYKVRIVFARTMMP